jgi:hypothetical protein
MKFTSIFIRVLPCAALLAAAGLVTLSASEKPHFDSQLRDGAITVDGHYDDWYGNLQPFEQAPVAVQFLNDQDYLYMRMTASATTERREILRSGFTVWFDPAGGTKKHFGVRYPVVEQGSGGDDGGGHGGYGGGGGYGGYGGSGRRSPSGGSGGGDKGSQGGDSADSGDPRPGDRIDVLGPGKDDARMLTRDHAPGIDVAVREEQGTLQYELKVPLLKTADHPYAIEAVAGKPIGFGLESGRTQQHAFSMGQGGGGGFGGMGGGMGGRGGGMGGRGGGGHGGGGGGGGRQGGGGDAEKPLKGWGTVTIAPAPAPAR